MNCNLIIAHEGFMTRYPYSSTVIISLNDSDYYIRCYLIIPHINCHTLTSIIVLVLSCKPPQTDAHRQVITILLVQTQYLILADLVQNIVDQVWNTSLSRNRKIHDTEQFVKSSGLSRCDMFSLLFIVYSIWFLKMTNLLYAIVN